MKIPEKIENLFKEKPQIKVIVDGKYRYYRGLKTYLQVEAYTDNPGEVVSRIDAKV